MSEQKYSNPRIDGPGNAVGTTSGTVHADPAKIAWVGSMMLLGTIGSAATFSADAVILFFTSTGVTLCLGHSLGMHRRFIHRAYDCPRWMEYLFVHFGVLVGDIYVDPVEWWDGKFVRERIDAQVSPAPPPADDDGAEGE